MKKKPTDNNCWWSDDKAIYRIKYVYYYRSPKTHNERRQNEAAKADGYYVRPSRRRLPHTWDDLNYSWNYGKCWKRFTRRKHQYK